jgi:NADH:ubiquinone oxidoreductase subunit C
MFISLKSFINSRFGKDIVLDDLTNDYGYFIKVHQLHFSAIVSFLKNDPDVKLTLLDQIIAIPSQLFSQKDHNTSDISTLEILYQLKSLKLPYRVTLVLEINNKGDAIPSISSLFLGARWLEIDLCNTYNILIEKSDRDR